jgi:hypothetical protein
MPALPEDAPPFPFTNSRRNIRRETPCPRQQYSVSESKTKKECRCHENEKETLPFGVDAILDGLRASGLCAGA